MGAELCGKEWLVVPRRSDSGVGDLAFSYGGGYYVVETKQLSNGTGHTQREQRRQGYNFVKEQAQKYAGHWARAHPIAKVFACICTNKNGFEVIARLAAHVD